ncbi:ABC transporter substrate-binding protein [Pseudomonas rubra]|uniref:ABC transporter substrate-binding protein n=1 Tax=Pseudomonas rubra TaxID=2942627 RepID=A0ABT5PBB1_9PSED|nr:ABC transporter substrate-binding protein [Pseudomonas rubra]MDD1015600.1 ABC transporter substrate-binding protein [Pseudomonas rubra]MDD1040951.1 ABC transporter substrate-binding protein [Pseudomonas rubra]MDD1154800.1 ABC transporter substrate-binding protein [Pseudomonas rubra]
MKSNLLSFSACLLALSIGSAQAAPDMVVVAYGGAGQKAQDAAIFKPFSAQDGSKMIQSEYNGEMARIKVMVDTGNVDWDLVQIEGPDLMRGCDEGMYERLDWTQLGRAEQLIPDAAQACGSAVLVWSVAIAYDRNKLAQAPTSWADFWDVKKIPGKRGLRKRAVYNLEFALMADGVKVEDVYKVLATPAGVDRAFNKLSELKPCIQWWEAGAQPAQWLSAGDVVMTSTYSGRVAVAAQEGSPLALVWPGSLYGMDYWAIIKGSRHVDQAKRLIAFANQPDTQVRYVKQIPYGPTNTQAAAALDPKLASWVPTSKQNLEGALSMNVEFWVDHGDELEERFNAWASR